MRGKPVIVVQTPAETAVAIRQFPRCRPRAPCCFDRQPVIGGAFQTSRRSTSGSRSSAPPVSGKSYAAKGFVERRGVGWPPAVYAGGPVQTKSTSRPPQREQTSRLRYSGTGSAAP